MKRVLLVACSALVLACPAYAGKYGGGFRSFSAPRTYSAPRVTITPRSAPSLARPAPAPAKPVPGPSYGPVAPKLKPYVPPRPTYSAPARNNYYQSPGANDTGSSWFWMYMMTTQMGSHSHASTPNVAEQKCEGEYEMSEKCQQAKTKAEPKKEAAKPVAKKDDGLAKSWWKWW